MIKFELKKIITTTYAILTLKLTFYASSFWYKIQKKKPLYILIQRFFLSNFILKNISPKKLVLRLKWHYFCVFALSLSFGQSFGQENLNQPTAIPNPTNQAITNASAPNSSAKEPITTPEVIDQIQQTLIYSDAKKAKQATTKSKITIEYSNPKSESEEPQSEIDIAIAKPKNNPKEEQKQNLAHKAAANGQYEAAIELYKQILKSNPTNYYAEFALASCYHLIGQFSQAKALYYKLLKYSWQDENTKNELINNFISLMVEESPSEAVYFLTELSNQNPGSDYIIAGAAMAYDKINQPDKAILLLKKAININPKEIKYKFNLAIIYDKIGDYKSALDYYQDTINSYIDSADLESTIPVVEVKQRIKFIQTQI